MPSLCRRARDFCEPGCHSNCRESIIESGMENPRLDSTSPHLTVPRGKAPTTHAEHENFDRTDKKAEPDDSADNDVGDHILVGKARLRENMVNNS